MRPLLEQLEAGGEPTAALAYVAAQAVPFDEDELRAVRRRALLLLATGGDPRRGLAPDARAVVATADDLDLPERRAAFSAALAQLRTASDGLPTVSASLDALLADADTAWRWLALAVVAEEFDDTST
jgi:hypothetical protein